MAELRVTEFRVTGTVKELEEGTPAWGRRCGPEVIPGIVTESGLGALIGSWEPGSAHGCLSVVLPVPVCPGWG